MSNTKLDHFIDMTTYNKPATKHLTQISFQVEPALVHICPEYSGHLLAWDL